MRDKIDKLNALLSEFSAEDSLRAVNIIASASIALAAQCSVLNSMREAAAMGRVYVEAKAGGH